MAEDDALRTLLVQLLGKVDTVLEVQRRQDQRLQHLEDASTTLSADVKTVQQTLNDHTQTLNDHTRMLNDHTQTLNDHTRTLNDHTQILQDHTRMLNDHTRTLNDQGKILNDQGRALARIDGRLDEQRQTLNALIPVRTAAA